MTENKYLEAVDRIGGIIEPVHMIHFPKLQLKTKKEVIDLLTLMRYSGGDLSNRVCYDIYNYDPLFDKLITAIKRGLV